MTHDPGIWKVNSCAAELFATIPNSFEDGINY